MGVLVEDSAEPVSSAYIQVDDSLGIRDRVGGGAQRHRLVQGLMCLVLVVEVFLLAQGVLQVDSRHPDTDEHRFDAGFGEDLIHEGRGLPISISEQKARSAARIVQIHHQTSSSG